MSDKKPTLIVSSCLMGNAVRWNATASSLKWLINEFSEFVNIKTICPEMMMGMGVPRPTVRLAYDPSEGEKEDAKIKMVETKSGDDKTSLAHDALQQVVDESRGVDGFILKSKSPSCGLDRVKLYNQKSGYPDLSTHGLFAEALLEEYQDSVFIDDGRLNDAHLREHFVLKLFVFFRFKNIEHKVSELQKFHRDHKYLFMCYSQTGLKELGQITSNHKKLAFEEVYANYFKHLKILLKSPPKAGQVCNALVHVYGYFKNDVNSAEKEHILNVIEDYRKGLSTITTPIELLNMLVKKYDVQYLKDQVLFEPYPKSLALRKFI